MSLNGERWSTAARIARENEQRQGFAQLLLKLRG